MILDVRVRPPYKGYLDTIMFRNTPRTAGISRRLGSPQAPSVSEHSLELMLQEMEQAGITKAVIPGRRANPGFGNVPNEDIDELLTAYPERFVGLAAIDPSLDTAIDEIRQWVVNGRFKGIVMEPGVLSEPMHIDDERIYPIYDFCEKNNILVGLMTGAAAGPDVTYTMPEHMDRVAKDFPKARFISYHAGYPWTSEAIYCAMRRGNVYLSPDMYMVRTPGFQDYVAAADHFLTDRFLFGTAYPFVTFEEGVSFFKSCGIRETVMEDLLWNNAAKLFGLI